ATSVQYASCINNTFATAACWADDIKSSTSAYSTWHYIDLPFSLDGTATSGIVPAAFDVVQAVNLCVTNLQNPGLTPSNQAVNLRFLLHFVGDIQQPHHRRCRRQYFLYHQRLLEQPALALGCGRRLFVRLALASAFRRQPEYAERQSGLDRSGLSLQLQYEPWCHHQFNDLGAGKFQRRQNRLLCRPHAECHDLDRLSRHRRGHHGTTHGPRWPSARGFAERAVPTAHADGHHPHQRQF